ncbi:MAG TPA: HpcH/HpaI aldolase/citrate lyase family protein, partial [Vicinamibacteria bacterium]|nr:HpcH/HpaI aldolase/citrate lyase family protein [Vicinamibacteria bacterium]
MDVPRNAFKRAIAEGRRQIGFWLSLGSPAVAELVAGAGYDWVLIDTEHAPNELPDVIDQLRALEGGTATPVVRPAWNDLVLIKRLLDAGAQTLLVPFVRSAEEAARAVAATRYAPQGIRGVATVTRASRYGRTEDYARRAQEELCVIVQLETRASLGELEAIAAVPGLDALFIGPADLAADLGHLGDSGHPDVQAAIADACARCARIGKPVGTFAPAEADARRYLDLGMTFAAVGNDAVLLRQGAD